MRKFLLFLGLVAFGSCWAQKLDKALLWKISGNGLVAPSYLYGTIHVTCDATLDKGVKPAMDDTRQLVLEVDMDDPTLQSAMMGNMMMKDGKKMTDLAGPDDIKIVDDYLRENLGMPLEMMNSVKPVFISMMFLTKVLDCPIQSVEKELMDITAAQNETVSGLETIAEQMLVMDAAPYEEQMDELVKSAKTNLAEDKKNIAALLALYKSKDIEGMLKAVQTSQNVLGAKYEDALLTTRNQNWIPKIDAIAKEKPTFFAVGAAHLAGENGVIKLLRKKGYKVEAVK